MMKESFLSWTSTRCFCSLLSRKFIEGSTCCSLNVADLTCFHICGKTSQSTLQGFLCAESVVNNIVENY